MTENMYLDGVVGYENIGVIQALICSGYLS